MKLSRKSWHARWWSIITNNDYPPCDLCSYFWLLILHTVKVGVILAIACALIAGIVTISVLAFKIVVRVVVSISCIGMVVLIIAEAAERREERPSVVVAWIKAKKAGICPLIEWEESPNAP